MRFSAHLNLRFKISYLVLFDKLLVLNGSKDFYLFRALFNFDTLIFSQK